VWGLNTPRGFESRPFRQRGPSTHCIFLWKPGALAHPTSHRLARLSPIARHGARRRGDRDAADPSRPGPDPVPECLAEEEAQPGDGTAGDAGHTAFQIGWDHAHYALVPPAEHLHEGNPVRQGWQAGRATFGRRTLQPTRLVRRWLALRLRAWLRGCSFELTQLTPNYLGQIEAATCPVTRRALRGDESELERINAAAGYAAGNLAMLDAAALAARGTLDWHDAWAQAQRLQDAGTGTAAEAVTHGLDAAAWARLAVLMSFVTPLPHAQAARLPLLVMPPNRLRLLNPTQGLQALVTRELARPGWSARLRQLADGLPGEALRHDFHLFVGALVPRLLAAGDADALATRHALEDAWQDPRVNRRWQRFALALDAPRAEALLQRAATVLGGRALLHSRAGATEGWALPTQGRVPAVALAVAPTATILPRPRGRWAAHAAATAAAVPLSGR
jgi:hypothetical protein